MLKPKIIELIEQGYDNDVIEIKTGASKSHIVHTRMAYNALLPSNQRKRSVPKLTAPKHGTIRRKVYDYMILNPKARLSDVVSNTGVCVGTAGSVRHRYFGPHL
jgi:hypothetical protein